MQDRILEVNLETAVVRMNNKLLNPTIVGTKGRNGTRFRLEICFAGAKRTIVRSRLVYIAGTMRLIPEGFQVHHLDEDRYNDSFENLIALSEQDHIKLHRHTSQSDDDTPF